jgi:hypothetical protein
LVPEQTTKTKQLTSKISPLGLHIGHTLIHDVSNKMWVETWIKMTKNSIVLSYIS